MLAISDHRLTLNANPLLRRDAAAEAESGRLPHLAGDLRHIRKNRKIEAREAVQARTAVEALGTIPGPDEAFHLVISGIFALFDFLPAVLQLAETPVTEVVIATLGYSRRNVTAMGQLVDAGQIGHVRLLFSHYFLGTSTSICEYADEVFTARADRMEKATARTHAKIMLLALPDGRRVTIETSANLRSCRNIEQATAIGDPALYEFHRTWIMGLMEAAKNGQTTKDRR